MFSYMSVPNIPNWLESLGVAYPQSEDTTKWPATYYKLGQGHAIPLWMTMTVIQANA
jgi:hypothetical protein